MPHALIVAHGQPSDPEPAEAALARYASQIDALSGPVSVLSATLAAPGSLEAQLDGLPHDTVVYPLFMAKGWFVTSALPKRLGDRQLPVLDPLGVDPELPGYVAETLSTILATAQWDPHSTDLVIAAHGSGRSRNPSAVATQFATELEYITDFRSIRLGFVEESPSIAEAATGAGEQALCLPFFACKGGHVLEDVPEELARAGFAGQIVPVVGELSAVQHQIAKKLRQAFETT